MWLIILSLTSSTGALNQRHHVEEGRNGLIAVWEQKGLQYASNQENISTIMEPVAPHYERLCKKEQEVMRDVEIFVFIFVGFIQGCYYILVLFID